MTYSTITLSTFSLLYLLFSSTNAIYYLSRCLILFPILLAVMFLFPYLVSVSLDISSHTPSRLLVLQLKDCFLLSQATLTNLLTVFSYIDLPHLPLSLVSSLSSDTYGC
jgi:hypothetical protein